MVALIVGVDVLFLGINPTVVANMGIVLVFLVFYLSVLRNR